MIEFNELMAKAREVKLIDPEFNKHLRDLLADNGVLLQLLGMIIEQRDGMAEGLVQLNFASEEGRLAAIQKQSMVKGIDQVLAVIYSAAVHGTEEEKSHVADKVP